MYLTKRVSWRQYAGLILMLVPILYHFFVLIRIVSKDLSINSPQSTVFYKWIGFEVDSRYAFFYFAILPICCCLGVNQLGFEDLNSGFNYQYFFRRSPKYYLIQHILASFLSGVMIAVIPLLLDLWLCWAYLPTVLPNWLVGGNTTILPSYTYFSALFYSHPYSLIFFYISLAGLFGGVVAVFSFAIGLITKHIIIMLSSSYLLFKLFEVMAGYWPKIILSPNDAVMPYATLPLPSLMNLLIILISILLIAIAISVWRVDRLAND